MSMALTAETPKLRASSVEVAGGGGECQSTEIEREGGFVWDSCLCMATVYSIDRIEVRAKYSQIYY